MEPGTGWRIPVVALLLVQCNDKDPSQTSTSGVLTEGSGDPTGTSPTEGETGSGETGSGGQHAPCERYLLCLAATTPEVLPNAQAGFGESGTCWQGTPAEAAQCVEGCRAGLAQTHAQYPDEPACLPCAFDDECAAGQLCGVAGECVTRCVDGEPDPCECKIDTDCGDNEQCAARTCTLKMVCGDGIVEAGEVCDGQAGCDGDCQGPAACTPYANTGCPTGQACQVVDGTPACVDLPADYAGPGMPCGDQGYSDTYGYTDYDTDSDPAIIACAGGLWCGPCGDYYSDECCQPYCAVDGEPCMDGPCVPLGLPAPFDYLGVCAT